MSLCCAMPVSCENGDPGSLFQYENGHFPMRMGPPGPHFYSEMGTLLLNWDSLCCSLETHTTLTPNPFSHEIRAPFLLLFCFYNCMPQISCHSQVFALQSGCIGATPFVLLGASSNVEQLGLFHQEEFGSFS